MFYRRALRNSQVHLSRIHLARCYTDAINQNKQLFSNKAVALRTFFVLSRDLTYVRPNWFAKRNAVETRSHKIHIQVYDFLIEQMLFI